MTRSKPTAAAIVKSRMLSITISSAEVAQQILDDPTGKIARQLDSRSRYPESRKARSWRVARVMGYGLSDG
ncbi:MAG: hypothetical protein R2856_26800 [Caldilineaceae bacterium]